MILVDTNILLDLVTDDPTWAEWSITQLETASLSGQLLINDVVYAELSVRYDRIETLDAFVAQAGLKLPPRLARLCSWPAKRSRAIGRLADPALASCLISSSAHMRR